MRHQYIYIWLNNQISHPDNQSAEPSELEAARFSLEALGCEHLLPAAAEEIGDLNRWTCRGTKGQRVDSGITQGMAR